MGRDALGGGGRMAGRRHPPRRCRRRAALAGRVEAFAFASAFVPCERPEGQISLSREHARTGDQSLKLRIREPVFGTATWVPKPTSCLVSGRYAEYTPDDKERAEIWESFDLGPSFGDDHVLWFLDVDRPGERAVG